MSHLDDDRNLHELRDLCIGDALTQSVTDDEMVEALIHSRQNAEGAHVQLMNDEKGKRRDALYNALIREGMPVSFLEDDLMRFLAEASWDVLTALNHAKLEVQEMGGDDVFE